MRPAGPDVALVAAALANPDRFVDVIHSFETQLRRYIRRLLGQNSSAADDVLQEAFIKAYVNLNDFDPHLRLGPWLYRIAHNVAMDHLRRHASESRHLSDADMDVIAECVASEAKTDSALLERAGTTALHRGLEALGERYRNALILRFLEEKSYLEIADVMRIPPGTVATLIRRGLVQLLSMIDLTESGLR